MIAFFVALAIVVGVVEITVIIQVGQLIGFLNTVGLLLLVSVVGAWLVKRQGLGVVARIREQRSAGRLPATEVFDGALVLIAAAILLVPGFITDVIGLLLLVPFVRSMVKWAFWRRMRTRLMAVSEQMGGRRAPPIKVQAIRMVDRGEPGAGSSP